MEMMALETCCGPLHVGVGGWPGYRLLFTDGKTEVAAQ